MSVGSFLLIYLSFCVIAQSYWRMVTIRNPLQGTQMRQKIIVSRRRERMKLTVRKAMEQDIPHIMELLLQVEMVHHLGRPDLFKGPATKYNEEELKTILRSEETPVFVCVDETDRPLGHAFCIHKQVIGNAVLTDVKTLYIDDICVDSSARGKHVGKTLYEYVIDYAGKRGYYNVTLNVWTCNPAAMKFYGAMGMTPQRIGMEKILE